MKRISTLILGFAFCFFHFVAAQTNLITNGSFENFAPPCPTSSPNGAFYQVLNWRPANDIPGLGSPHPELYCGEPNYGGCLPGPVPNVGSDGTAYVGFHTRIFTPPYNESIYQVLATPLIAGEVYTVSFDLMDCQSGLFTAGPSDFCVYTNIDTVVPACPSDSPSVTLVGCVPFDSISNVAWKHHSFSFTAPPNSNIIAFSGAACNVSEIYYYLDNVELYGQSVSASFNSSNNRICPETCIDFTNLSVNATSYQWSFTGGSPAADTSENPSHICYSTPGVYSVTLIASNATSSDTLTLNNYVTVDPIPAAPSIFQSGDTLSVSQTFASYQWFYGSDTIAGATNYFYVATQSGNYNLIVTDTNGCSVGVGILNVMTGIQTETAGSEFGVNVFPNPVTNQFAVRSSEFVMKEITIYNTLGQKVFSEELNTKYKTINTKLSSGIYLLKITSGDKIFTKAFVVER